MSKPVPQMVARQYAGGARGFRSEKRANLRALTKAYGELRVGSAYFPGGNEPLERIGRAIEELRVSLSVATWGK